MAQKHQSDRDLAMAVHMGHRHLATTGRTLNPDILTRAEAACEGLSQSLFTAAAPEAIASPARTYAGLQTSDTHFSMHPTLALGGSASPCGTVERYSDGGKVLRQLMVRCLAVDPEQRPSAGEVVQLLKEVAGAML